MMDHFSFHSFTLILLSSLWVSSSLLLSPPAVVAADDDNISVMDNKTTTDIRLALISFKSMLSDPLGSLASWDDNNGSLHYCLWRGITCGRRHPLHVVALDLDSLGLSGTISPVISNLTFLRRLHLPDNQLDGRIPEELGRLSRLRYLNLNSNHLTGEIPPNITRCFSLQFLSLRDNILGGEIPSGIGSLLILESLYLGDNNLNGRIPPLLGSSHSLVKVGLSNNSLTGGIPPFLANCSTLQNLILYDNSLTGGVPPSLGNSTSLTFLNLGNNRLTGGIPPFLMKNPSPLIELSLLTNSLTGEIPPSLGNLSSMRYLDLCTNNLEGSIPESLGNIPNLEVLDLILNNLSNRIPSTLYNVSTITRLAVDINMLSGTLPPDIGLTLPNLQYLQMSTNRFEGPIPISLSNASSLVDLNLRDNSFSGEVPPNLGSLQNLWKLDIGGNQLEAHDWSFFSSLTNCSLLKTLCFDGNKIKGELPRSVGDLSTRLQWLKMGRNQIFGTIPAEIGNLVNLTLLSMKENLFVGHIPTAIGKLQNLNVLDLSRNNLSGPIPSSIGDLFRLNKLYMQENELSGAISASIGGCKSLGILNLSNNELGGTIPRELVSLSSLTQYLDLSHNCLVGSVPMEVGRLINLGGLNVSRNQLSGNIPSTLGACQHLEQLHIEGNFFQGNIPQSFKNLKGLTELDLSSNNLSGRIPNFFESLGSLQSLNLSLNDFEGEVPSGGVFSNASEISLLGNNKLCGGHQKLKLPPCSAHAHKRKFSRLKIIILVVSTITILSLSLIGILYMRRRKTGKRGPAPVSFFDGERYRKISYADIHKAIDGFSSANLVGAGSFGSVYKGKIEFEESIVAVKILNLYKKGASRSFTTECEALRSIRHRNLVKIITTCSSVDCRGNDFKALVFEYMPNGSLENWLHPEVGLQHPQPQKLTLIQRLNIAIDVASALDYLHHNCQPPVVHCDLKPSNVLLDNDMMARVGDFGLARLLSKSNSVASKSSSSSIGIKGTVGYVAPEYGVSGQVSTQGDVYSFGVLLLEMLTGKKPTAEMFKDGLSLRRDAEMAIPEGVLKIMDPQLVSRDEGDQEADDNIMNESSSARERSRRCISSMITIGLLCSNDAPRERMEMKDVTIEMQKIKEQFLSVEDHERNEGR